MGFPCISELLHVCVHVCVCVCVYIQKEPIQLTEVSPSPSWSSPLSIATAAPFDTPSDSCSTTDDSLVSKNLFSSSSFSFSGTEILRVIFFRDCSSSESLKSADLENGCVGKNVCVFMTVYYTYRFVYYTHYVSLHVCVLEDLIQYN